MRGSDLSPDKLAGRVAEVLTLASLDLAQGALITLDAERSRLRLLPLR